MLQCAAGDKGKDRTSYGPYLYVLEPAVLAVLTMHGKPDYALNIAAAASAARAMKLHAMSLVLMMFMHGELHCMSEVIIQSKLASKIVIWHAALMKHVSAVDLHAMPLAGC